MCSAGASSTPADSRLLVAIVAVLRGDRLCRGRAPPSSSGGSEPAASQPPASRWGTGGYVPAAGTDKSGAMFQTYSDPKLGYHLLYPGGWNVSHAKGVVRIAKLGNVIVIASRAPSSRPR